MTESNRAESKKRQLRRRKRHGRPAKLTTATAALLLAVATLQTDAFSTTTTGASLSSRSPQHVGNTLYAPSSVAMSTSSLRMSSLEKSFSNDEDSELLKQVREYTNLAISQELLDDNEGNLTLLRRKDKATIARKKLLTKHMGLVHYTVNTIIRRRSRKSLLSLTRHDLIQEGFLGLNRAVDSFEFNKGASFPTYAVYWIKASVHRAIAKEDNLIRVPEYVTMNLRKLHMVAYQLQMDLDLLYSAIVGRDDEEEENMRSKTSGKVKNEVMTKEEMWSTLQSETGLTEKQIKECLKVREWRKQGGYTHLQPWMQQEDGFQFPMSSFSPEQDNMQTSDPEDLKKMLSQYLRPKEVEAISWRYGLNADEMATKAAARDYEAEAEFDLFGPEGVLSSASVSQTSLFMTPSTSQGRNTRALSARKAPEALKKVNTRRPNIPKKGKWGEDMTFAEIGARMAVSAEYTRRLTKVALEKLRKAVEEGRLEPDFLV